MTADVVRIRANRGLPLLPAQWRLLRERPDALTHVVVGGWRSGKTRGAALDFLASCAANPWDPELYERDDHPQSLVVSKTTSVLAESAMRELRAVVPPEAIRRVWRGNQPAWLLANGHLVRFRSWSGAIEGSTECSLWLDEAHLLDDSDTWRNLRARVTEGRARVRRIILSGLPETGWLRDEFEARETGDPTCHVVHASLIENRHIPADYVADVRRGLSAEDAAVYLAGAWRPAQGAIYHAYDPSRHLAGEGDRGRYVHLGIDLGEQAAVVFGQEVPRRCRDSRGVAYDAPGLHVVDELHLDRCDAREVARRAKARGWLLVPGRSRVFLDPTVARDEVNAVREELGAQMSISWDGRGDQSHEVEFGIRSVQGALRDADGNVRLTFARTLPREPRALLTSIPKYRRNEKTQRPVKDNTTDHGLDALRYLVAHVLPAKAAGFRVV